MISAVVLTKNEENNIEECLKCLEFCDEIIVVDDDSSDATRKIAENLGARVYLRSIDMDFATQSNSGMKKASAKWIIFLDADERVDKNLSDEIVKVTKSEGHISGYFIKRRDFMWGKELSHGESGNQMLLRLVKKNSGKWMRRVHPYFDIKGKTSVLKNSIHHYPHKSVTNFIESVDRWSTWHALANKEEGKKSNLLKICLWPLGHFLKNYFLRLGFLDGIRGFVFAVIMSFHSFLGWGKLWIVQRNHSNQLQN